MSYDLSIGKQVENRFFQAGAAIARDVENGQFDQVRNKLNAALFQGGPSTPKNFKQLISISDPSSEVITHRKVTVKQNPETNNWERDGRLFYLFEIEKKISFSAVMGVLEGIPVIGSAIAIIMTIGHLISMSYARTNLQSASENLIQDPSNDVSYKTREVFAHALKYTMHRNYLIGSLLSIVPLLKPIVRLIQGIMSHQRAQQQYEHQHVVASITQTKPAAPSKYLNEDIRFKKQYYTLKSTHQHRIAKRKYLTHNKHRAEITSLSKSPSAIKAPLLASA